MDDLRRDTSVQLVGALSDLASDWIDLDFGPRREAEERTLACANRFTEQALAFAINQQMSLLTEDALLGWARKLQAPARRTVGVLNPGNVPLAGFQDFLAVLLSGHRYTGSVSSRSPVLLPAIADDLRSRYRSVEASFVDFDSLVSSADAIIAGGSDETMSFVRQEAVDHGIDEECLLLRGHRYSVCVIDGSEGEEECFELAEDILLHEGQGCRNVAIVWAPERASPDAILDAMAGFRATFPAHPDTSGGLEMQRALLGAGETPIAYGDGLVFLMSKGEPEVQMPGHVRWSEYATLEEVEAWIREYRQELQLIVFSDRINLRIPDTLETTGPGEAQRPRLGWLQDGIDIAEFLKNL